MKRKMLVIGGSGFVGTNLNKYMKEHHKETYEVLSTGFSRYSGNDVFLDCYDKKSIYELFVEFNPHVVVNLSAYVGGIKFNKEQPATMIDLNLTMGMNVLDAFKSYHKYCSSFVPKLIYLGTVCSYPKVPNTIPFVESELWLGRPEETNESYGLAKKTIGFIANCYAKSYGINAAYLIPTNMYGPYDNFNLDSSHVIPALIRKLLEAKQNGDRTVQLWGSGKASRDFLHVHDCCRAIVAADKYVISPDPINVGTGVETRIYDLVNLIADIIDYRVEFVYSNDLDGQPRRCLDCSKANSLFGNEWSSSTCVDIVEGLRKTIDWYISN